MRARGGSQDTDGSGDEDGGVRLPPPAEADSSAILLCSAFTLPHRAAAYGASMKRVVRDFA